MVAIGGCGERQKAGVGWWAWNGTRADASGESKRLELIFGWKNEADQPD
jgi:hypothetical protein